MRSDFHPSLRTGESNCDLWFVKRIPISWKLPFPSPETPCILEKSKCLSPLAHCSVPLLIFLWKVPWEQRLEVWVTYSSSRSRRRQLKGFGSLNGLTYIFCTENCSTWDKHAVKNLGLIFPSKNIIELFNPQTVKRYGFCSNLPGGVEWMGWVVGCYRYENDNHQGATRRTWHHNRNQLDVSWCIDTSHCCGIFLSWKS